MPFNSKIMAKNQFSGINNADPRIFFFNLMEKATQILQTTEHDFNKAVVAKKLRKSGFPD